MLLPEDAPEEELIALWNGLSGTASGNVISGNYIGTDRSGSSAVGNFIGLQIFGGLDGVTENMIGGVLDGSANVISGNEATGLLIHGFGAHKNTVAGNLIGTDATGMAALGNGGSGVFLNDLTSENIVGGPDVGSRNVISGNVNGVTIARSASSNGTR